MNMTVAVCCVVSFVGVLVGAVFPALAADTTGLDERLGKVAATHPRLFFSEQETAGLKAKIEADPGEGYRETL